MLVNRRLAALAASAVAVALPLGTRGCSSAGPVEHVLSLQGMLTNPGLDGHEEQ